MNSEEELSPDQITREELIDAKVLGNLKSLRNAQSASEPDILVTLVDMFSQDVPLRLSSLREALDRGDMHQTERISHSLKSSCASIGAKSMADLCGFLENRATQGISEGGHEIVDRIQTHFALVAEILGAARDSQV